MTTALSAALQRNIASQIWRKLKQRSWRAASASSIERCASEISLNIVGPLASLEAERFSALTYASPGSA